MIMNIPFYSSIGSFLSQHSRIGGEGGGGLDILFGHPIHQGSGDGGVILVIFLGSPPNHLGG